MATRFILCRFGALDEKKHRHPSVCRTPEFVMLQGQGCRAEYYSPPADETLAEGSPALVVLFVPDARAVELEPQIAAFHNGTDVFVLPNLRESDAPSGSQRAAIRSALSALGVNANAASAQSANLGDFLRYVLVNEWRNTQLDRARLR